MDRLYRKSLSALMFGSFYWLYAMGIIGHDWHWLSTYLVVLVLNIHLKISYHELFNSFIREQFRIGKHSYYILQYQILK